MRIDIGNVHLRVNNLQLGIYVLIAYFVVAKYYIWMWLLKPLQARPAMTRHNLSLGLIDFSAIAALVIAFFLMLVLGYTTLAPACVLLLLLYNYALRTWRINAEVRRLMNSSKKWRYRDARRHVRQQARTTTFQ